MNLIPIFLVRYQFHLKPWVFGPFETFKNTWVLLVLGSCSFLARIVSLRTNQFQLARVSAIGYVLTYIWGWGSAQYPYLIKPDLAIYNTAASPSSLALLLSALVAVIIVVFPSLWYLFRMFKNFRIGMKFPIRKGKVIRKELLEPSYTRLNVC